MNNIPDYTDHYKERMEAAARTREAFQNRMQPTIHVQLQVRKIAALSYEAAMIIAHGALSDNDETYAVMVKLNAAELVQFTSMARVAKEMDGTYTVTLP